MKILLFLCVGVTIYLQPDDAVGQLQGSGGFGAVISDLQGAPVKVSGISDIQGSPFLLDTWNNGELTLNNGSVLQNVPVKFNLSTNEIHFLRTGRDGDQQQEIIIQTGLIKEFKIFESTPKNIIAHLFRSGFPEVDGLSKKTYYEVLAEGNIASILKSSSKSIVEEKPFNSASVTRKYAENEVYYVLYKGQMLRMKKGKEFVYDLFADQRKKVEEFVKSSGIKCKAPSDWKELIEFMNKSTN